MSIADENDSDVRYSEVPLEGKNKTLVKILGGRDPCNPCGVDAYDISEIALHFRSLPDFRRLLLVAVASSSSSALRYAMSFRFVDDVIYTHRRQCRGDASMASTQRNSQEGTMVHLDSK